MYFVIVVVLAFDGMIFTVAKEVESRVECDKFEERARQKWPDEFKLAVCERWEHVDNAGLSDG